MGSPYFRYYDQYWGLIEEDPDPLYPSKFYAFETISDANRLKTRELQRIPLTDGACYCFVSQGLIRFMSTVDRDPGPSNNKSREILLGKGEYAVFSGSYLEVEMTVDSACFVAQRVGYHAPFTCGGPVEKYGRLRYIDGCTDSVLIHPAKAGDPVLNHLHFPELIDQTAHTHPSVRMGTVLDGEGWCRAVAEDLEMKVVKLTPSRLWVIPPGCFHKFGTVKGNSLDVVPYHPDSDHGPMDENHPMVNRTLVDGSKIDNSGEDHVPKEVMDGWTEYEVPC